ncbi:MAG: sulfite exporter TauE/SafE family protein [Burkholderiales bacterium]
MDAALAVSALMMGLAGGPHCAAMCGAAFGGIAGRHGPARATRAMWALQLGRLAGYAAAGALVAASVSGLTELGVAAPLLRPLWAMLHVAAIALGACLLWQGRAPAWLAGAGARAGAALQTQPLRFVARVPAPARSAAIGACWALMPCGLLQSALIVAALASGPVQGAVVMAGFAASSALGLLLAPLLWQRVRQARGWAAASTLPVRLAGVLLIGASGFALAHGLGAAIAAVCATPAG